MKCLRTFEKQFVYRKMSVIRKELMLNTKLPSVSTVGDRPPI